MTPTDKEKTSNSGPVDLPFSSEWNPNADPAPIPPVEPPSPASREGSPPAPGRSPSPLQPTAGPSPKPLKVCPKCGHRQSGRFSCDRCGLIFSNYRVKSDNELFPNLDPGLLESLKKKWDEIPHAPNPPQALQDFVKTAQAMNALPFAADRLRRHLIAHPEDSAAETLRQQIMTQAMFLLDASRPKKQNKEPSRRTVVLVIIGAVLLTVFLSWLFIHLMR